MVYNPYFITPWELHKSPVTVSPNIAHKVTFPIASFSLKLTALKKKITIRDLSESQKIVFQLESLGVHISFLPFLCVARLHTCTHGRNHHTVL